MRIPGAIYTYRIAYLKLKIEIGKLGVYSRNVVYAKLSVNPIFKICKN